MLPIKGSASEIIAQTMTRSPRKIKQILNNFTTLYLLAESKEEKNFIAKGLITNNTEFLAKTVLLREDYPQFYNLLHFENDLLEQIEQYITSADASEDEERKFQQIFSKNTGLKDFLSSTLGIKSHDIAPFLTLSQERFGIEIANSFDFDEKVQTGNHEFVLHVKELKDSNLVGIFVKRIVELLDKNIKLNRYVTAANCVSVLIEIYDIIPPNIQPYIIESLGRRISLSNMKLNVKRFNTTKLFKMIPNFETDIMEQLFIVYSRQITEGENVNNVILNNLVLNKVYLSAKVLDIIDDQTATLLRKNEELGFDTLQRLVQDKLTSSISKTLDAVADRINPLVSPEEQDITRKRLDRYIQLKNFASEQNKKTFTKLTIFEA